jgi:DegV family protein with EDD domain
MTVRIITDSLSDLTKDLADEFGVTVVPLTVLFGHEAYLDRVTISTDQFYDRLIHGGVWPTTTQPTPQAFAEAYEKAGAETDEILVVTISSRMSGTYQSAVSAKAAVGKKYKIEVIDSTTVGMGLGLIVVSAAKAAKKGAKLAELAEMVRGAMRRSHFIVYFDTLKYLAKGGRAGKAQALLGSLLSVKPILTTREGEMAPLTRARSLRAGMEYLYNFVASFAGRIEELAVEHTTTQDEADKLAAQYAELLPKQRIFRSTVSPVLGTYGGPGAVAVTVLAAAGTDGASA